MCPEQVSSPHDLGGTPTWMAEPAYESPSDSPLGTHSLRRLRPFPAKQAFWRCYLEETKRNLTFAKESRTSLAILLRADDAPIVIGLRGNDFVPLNPVDD